VWGGASDIRDVPPVLVERLQHYFLTYKFVPGRRSKALVTKTYGQKHALRVIRAAMADYEDEFVEESTKNR
jgi:inorganic pyrophosphatase